MRVIWGVVFKARKILAKRILRSFLGRNPQIADNTAKVAGRDDSRDRLHQKIAATANYGGPVKILFFQGL